MNFTRPGNWSTFIQDLGGGNTLTVYKQDKVGLA